jgi:hypothetical protein
MVRLFSQIGEAADAFGLTGVSDQTVREPTDTPDAPLHLELPIDSPMRSPSTQANLCAGCSLMRRRTT